MYKLFSGFIVAVILTQIVFLIIRYTHIYIIEPMWLFAPSFIGGLVVLVTIISYVIIHDEETRDDK